MKQTIFKGSGVAIITPMLEDGSVNYPVLKELLEQQDKNKKIDTFNRADEKYQEAGRDRPDKRPEKRYDIRNADYNTD